MGARDMLHKVHTVNELAGRLGRALSSQALAQNACTGPQRLLIGCYPSQFSTARS